MHTPHANGVLKVKEIEYMYFMTACIIMTGRNVGRELYECIEISRAVMKGARKGLRALGCGARKPLAEIHGALQPQARSMLHMCRQCHM